MTKIVHAVGARPNFVKMAPVIDALTRVGGFDQMVVHTGQHYDARMSNEVIADVNFPAPDRFLGVGSGSHGEQTGKTLIAFEVVLLEEQPDLVVVSGDVNATLACALAAAKLDIPVAHIESGLRSYDWAMPEEINRVLVDRLSTYLFTHSPEAEANLLAEGIAADRIHYVGNTMIDSLRSVEEQAESRAFWETAGVRRGDYLLVTLHRPSNVDDPQMLDRIVHSLVSLPGQIPVVFPVHPRTRMQLERSGGLARLDAAGVVLLEPLRYMDFLSLEIAARAVVTDSGGVQEETSALGVRCYTLRRSTERPVTVSLGTNTLLGEDPEQLIGLDLSPVQRSACTIPLWDGAAGARVAEVIARAYGVAPARAASAQR